MSGTSAAAFQTPYRPTQEIIPAYVYDEYADDVNVQAFFASYNALSQSYLNWFNATPLAVYTSPFISGPLLDWIATGIYGIRRPVLSSETVTVAAGYNSTPYNTLAYNALAHMASGTASLATDDIYKRVLTWHLYRGDGQQFSLQWLKNRISRFINGANGSDYPVLSSPPSITVSASVFTATVPSNSSTLALQQCVNGGVLALPFEISLTIAV